MELGQSFTFVASVSGSENTNVTWSTNGGELVPDGTSAVYTAPDQVGTFEIIATSEADPTQSATAVVTVVNSEEPGDEIEVSISPASAELLAGGEKSFTATVTGADDDSVTWAVDGGSIDGTGNTITYVAPDAAGSYTLTATSVADATKSASAQITVTHGAAEVLWTHMVATPEVDQTYGIARDSAGNIVIVGHSKGDLEGDNAGEFDAYIRKLAPDGTTIWTKHLSTDGDDRAYAVAVDANDNIIVVGDTSGELVRGAKVGAIDIFVAKFSADGALGWQRQIGSTGLDYARGVAVDAAGDILVTGAAGDSIQGQPAIGSADVFVIKLKADGRDAWARQFGSDERDRGRGIVVDSTGHIIVSGFMGDEAINGSENSWSRWVFVSKLDSDGLNVWTRKFGASVNDWAVAVALDADDNIHIAGSIKGNLDSVSHGDRDVLVRKLSPDGTTVWSRQIGTSAADEAEGIAVDQDGNVIVTGRTAGNFAAADANAGGNDVFMVKFNAAGDEVWRAQFGTAGDDIGRALTTDADGNIFLCGDVAGDIGEGHEGELDAFVRKFTP